MSTRPLRLLATLLAFGLVAAACGDDDEGVSSEGGGSGSDFLACEVTDTGGVDDRSFNETAYKGLADAAEEVGFEPAVLESDTEADFEPNIQAHLDNGCDLIVTVGFLLGDATAAAAEANPGTEFAIVDFDFYDSDADEDVTYDNVRELTFATDEAAFLAGYLAAAMTETGKVGTYGGLNIPTVTIFMKGFQAGIEFYNDENDTDVELIGWDSADPDGGSFTGDFENQTNGRQTTETLLDADVDIIMPVAGPVGLGTIEAVEADGGDIKVIWVDTDGCVSVADSCDLFLTSVMKNMDVAVRETVLAAADGNFENGLYTGTLENDGVAIAPFHEYDDEVPQEVKDRLEELRADIISGDVEIGG